MEVQMPSAYDPTLAPEGRHVLSIWAMYAPSRLSAGAWGNHRKNFGERIIELLSRYAPNMKGIIQSWSLFTPTDIERRVGMTNGNIRHLDMIPSQSLALRPMPGFANYRTPIQNLYLCGAGTHPGGEVTGAPGHNAAHVIMSDLGLTPVQLSKNAR
jgi:phytoene dehydrogenase-like protein